MWMLIMQLGQPRLDIGSMEVLHTLPHNFGP